MLSLCALKELPTKCLERDRKTKTACERMNVTHLKKYSRISNDLEQWRTIITHKFGQICVYICALFKLKVFNIFITVSTQRISRTCLWPETHLCQPQTVERRSVACWRRYYWIAGWDEQTSFTKGHVFRKPAPHCWHPLRRNDSRRLVLLTKGARIIKPWWIGRINT